MARREEAGWHAVHAATFGHDRWDDLSIALQRDPEHLCFLNPFLPGAELEVLKTDYGLEQTCIPGAFHFQLPDEADAQFRVVDSTDESVLFVEKVRAARHEVEIRGCDPSEALSPFIFAEGAFLIVALALRVEEGDRILDGGASPGAALVLAGALFARRCARGEPVPPDMQGFLVCNAASKQKSSHVQKMMSSLVPPNLVDHNAYGGTGGPRLVFMTADMGTPSNSVERNGPYDKILLSAPCTDDRRLARGANGGLTKWSSNGAKVSAERQLKWLYNALWLLRDNGILVFCSTALSPEECDGVVERLMLKVRGSFEIEVLPLEEEICRMVPGLAAESTDWGVRIMPDKTEFGPLYFSRLRLLKRTHQAASHN